LGSGGSHLKVYRVDDMVALRPFEASNKTSVIFLEKGKSTTYPVPYILWSKKKKSEYLSSELDIQFVLNVTNQELKLARPIKLQTSAWQTISENQAPGLDKLKGQSIYKAHSGVAVDPYGVYLVRQIGIPAGKTILITNASDLGKTKVNSTISQIETDLLYPAVRGKDIARWKYHTEIFVLITNKSPRKEDQISEKEMRRRYPNAYEYLQSFKSPLLKRGKLWAFYGKDTDLKEIPSDLNGKYYQRKRTTSAKSGVPVVQVIDVPFYAMRDIGSYSFADYKVVWQMGASEIKAAVIEPENTTFGVRPVLPCTGTVSYVACQSHEEAFYICACPNSKLANLFFCSFSSAGRGLGAPSILKQIKLHRFSPSNPMHQELADLAAKCHSSVSCNQLDNVMELEKKIDLVTASLWGVNESELNTLLG